MIEHKSAPKCSTASVLDKLAGICCIRVPNKKKAVKRSGSRRPSRRMSEAPEPKTKDDKVMQFVTQAAQ